jgi:hypothetical protein
MNWKQKANDIIDTEHMPDSKNWSVKGWLNVFIHPEDGEYKDKTKKNLID